MYDAGPGDGRTEVQRSVGRRKADADQEAAGYRRGTRGRKWLHAVWAVGLLLTNGTTETVTHDLVAATATAERENLAKWWAWIDAKCLPKQ